MNGRFHQSLKYYKFRRVPAKKGKVVFYLFFHKEEDTYAALRAAKPMKEISLVRYRPKNPVDYESTFRPFPPKQIINICRYAFRKYLDRFHTVVSEQIYTNFICSIFYVGSLQIVSPSCLRTNNGTRYKNSCWSVFPSFHRHLSTLLAVTIVHERIDKLCSWWWMNKQFPVKDNDSVQKLLDVFFG